MKKLNLLTLVIGLLATATVAASGSCTTITGETQKTTSPPVSVLPTTTPNMSTATVTASQTRPFPSQQSGVINASPGEVSTWLSDSKLNLYLIDVRTPAEFTSGHIAKAVNIDYESTDFGQNIDKLDKEAYYIVYCRTGARSAAASQIMLKQGFNHIINMTGGITDWINEGLDNVKN
jgi:phage shock protein E